MFVIAAVGAREASPASTAIVPCRRSPVSCFLFSSLVRVFRAREALRKQVAVSSGTCAEHGCVKCTSAGGARGIGTADIARSGAGMLAARSMKGDERDERDAVHWDAVEEATELLADEQYHAALAVLRDLLKKDPTNPYAFFFLGQALYEVGEVEASRDAYRAALVLAPKHLGARIALTHVLRKLGEHREAIQEGLLAVEQAPTDADALYAAGMAFFARGDKVSARRYLEAFLHARPELEVRLEVEAVLDAMAREESN